MGGSLLSKAEVPGSSLLGHLPKEFSLRLTWCPWLVGYYGTRGISRGARKLARTPSLSKKKKKNLGLEAKKINFLSSNILVGINSSEQVNCQTYIFLYFKIYVFGDEAFY